MVVRSTCKIVENSLIRWNMWRFLQHVLCSKAQSCGSKFEGKAGGRELSDAMIAREFMNAKEIPVTLNTSTPPPNITVAMQKIDSQWKIPLNLNRTFFSYIAWEEQHVLFVSGSNFIFIGCQEAAVTPLIDSSVEKANLRVTTEPEPPPRRQAPLVQFRERSLSDL